MDIDLNTETHLVSTPLLADYLQDGLEAHGYSRDDE